MLWVVVFGLLLLLLLLDDWLGGGGGSDWHKLKNSDVRSCDVIVGCYVLNYDD